MNANCPAPLQHHWGLTPARLGYLPVDSGDHHWEVTDAEGRRWFVTVAGLAARRGPTVITHGEPHPGNILRSAGRLYLIDWDTVGLALPERDLWALADADSREADRYAELTGRRVSAVVMRMYRMRWSLDEIMLSVREFRGPHEQDEDT